MEGINPRTGLSAHVLSEEDYIRERKCLSAYWRYVQVARDKDASHEAKMVALRAWLAMEATK